MTSPPSLSQKRPPQGLSIGLKIFSIATSLLGLIVLVVYVSTDRLRKVNTEITVLSDYVIPITNQVAKVDVHVLEQELHFERVQKLYEIEPPDSDQIQAELDGFEHRGELVDQEIATAVTLAQTALNQAQLPQNKAEWRDIEPLLEAIEIEHQQFHDHAAKLLALLKTGDRDTIQSLEAQLIVEETDFNQAINDIFLELEAFTVQAAQAGQQHQQVVQNLSLGVAASATVFGLIYATLVTLGLVRPVRALAQGIAAVQAGQLDTQLDIPSRDEVGTLAHAFNAMVGELQLKARLEDTFGKYVDPRIIQTLMEESSPTATTGERQVMTVLFADVDGLETAIASLDPDSQIRIINTYLSLMSAPITAHDGVIDKFIGTTIMAFWGPPFTAADSHARLACEAALAQVAQLQELCSILTTATAATDLVPLHLHIGISTGTLVVGNMGSQATKSFTVMGDTVNIASRLKGASKQYGVSALLSHNTQAQIANNLEIRDLDWIQVVGKQEPIQIYQLLGRKGSLSQAEESANQAFSQGLDAYRQQNWEQARHQFETALAQTPTDRVSRLYLDRVTFFQTHPPPTGWDGIWRLKQK